MAELHFRVSSLLLGARLKVDATPQSRLLIVIFLRDVIDMFIDDGLNSIGLKGPYLEVFLSFVGF